MSFIYAGRLDSLKGIEVLLEAWKLMAQDAPELVVCGKGPLDDLCRRQAGCLRMEVRGHINPAEVKEIIARSQALILPTLWYEGFPMTIAESFSVGTPVICSDLGNCGALVEQGVTGWKFQPGSAEGLVAAVKACTEAGDAIRQSVRYEYDRNYTPEANYRRLSEIYREVQNADRACGAECRKVRK